MSPWGEELEVLGQAGPVRLERVPYVPAEAREELLVLKDEDVFLCARPDGDLHPARVTGEGLYASDTRFLSELRLTLGGVAPVALSYVADAGYCAVVDATNATLETSTAVIVPQQSVNVRRTMLIGGGRLYHLIELTSFVPGRIETTLEVSLAADFADMFEVRGGPHRNARGKTLAARRIERGLALAYVGADEAFRETIVELDPEPAEIALDGDRAGASWLVELGTHEQASFLITAEPSIGGLRRRRRELASVRSAHQAESREWRSDCTAIATTQGSFGKLIEKSTDDLRALMMPAPGGEILAAGIPWYVAPFGRDSIITAYESLLLNTDLARTTLLVLAGLQARKDDAWRDAEPGKILHELRTGELARTGIIPHVPYYGTVDATPLFLMLGAAYWRWTADLETMTALRPAFDAALEWIDSHGDRDGDGFVEYERRSQAGLVNQGWKDSEDALVHADGRLAEGPIALAEVQGYVYMAKQRIADVYDALGSPDVAARLRDDAQALREAFDATFWMPAEGTFALALDGRKNQVASVTSNPLHCLYCGIVEPERAAAVAERAMADDMFSGWGIRTLSSSSPAYNPMSYHNGSVWPHDNAIAAAGLKRYGFDEAALRIMSALCDVAAQSRESRLPELYCGFERGDSATPVAYPVACIPQAWAAAVPFMLLQATLGISAMAPQGTLTVNRPNLPAWLERLELRGLRVGDAEVSLGFEREGDVTGVALLESAGSVNVNVALDPDPHR